MHICIHIYMYMCKIEIFVWRCCSLLLFFLTKKMSSLVNYFLRCPELNPSVGYLFNPLASAYKLMKIGMGVSYSNEFLETVSEVHNAEECGMCQISSGETCLFTGMCECGNIDTLCNDCKETNMCQTCGQQPCANCYAVCEICNNTLCIRCKDRCVKCVQ